MRQRLPIAWAGTVVHLGYYRSSSEKSYCNHDGMASYVAMFDGKVPAKSNDRSVPCFNTYAQAGRLNGTLQRVRKDFDADKTVSSCAVFWCQETQPPEGSVPLPKSWRVLYLDGKGWKPVEDSSGYDVKLDKFHVVTFTLIKTKALPSLRTSQIVWK